MVSAKKVGACMRSAAILGTWLAIGLAGHATAVEPDEQYALTYDGSRSGVSLSALDEMLLKADLRKGIQECVSMVYRADVRIYGALRFDFLLYPEGGVDRVKFAQSGLERMGLSGCIDRVIKKRFRGQRKGAPALVSGKLTIKPGEEDQFGFSVSARLSREQLQKDSALNGSFSKTLDGPVSMCSLGKARLVLRLSSMGAQKRRSLWAPQQRIPQSVERCMLLAEQADTRKLRHRSRRAKRRNVRRMIADCLKKVLKTGSWTDRAYAAEEIANNWRFRARRQIRKTIRDALCVYESTVHGSDGIDLAAADKLRMDSPGAGDDCDVTEFSSTKGHALVRMLVAQLRLGLRPTNGVMLNLARHPDPNVRLRLLDTVMSRWLDGIPEGLSRLIHDPDVRVRTRAQHIGCTRSDWQSMHAFEETMADSDPVVRALAILNARSCVEKNYMHMMDFVQRENEPILKMLMLRVLPVQKDELILEYAGPALFDPCPAVRYLALGILARMIKPPLELLKQFRKRERDPFIIKKAVGILAGTSRPKDTWEQVWLIYQPLEQKPLNLVREHDARVLPVGKLLKEHTVSSN